LFVELGQQILFIKSDTMSIVLYKTIYIF